MLALCVEGEAGRRRDAMSEISDFEPSWERMLLLLATATYLWH